MMASSSAETHRALPGDMHPTLDRLLRVDHAGEYGAQRIYAGQLAVLKHSPIAPEIRHMAGQEEAHLAAFNALLVEHRARPSALLPFWHVAGYVLGAATALMGEKTAMACTVAVESVIADHYQHQLDALSEMSPEAAAIAPTLAQFRAEEIEHHDSGLAHNAEDAPLYPLVSAVIKRGCRAAIWLAERV
jgi:ubiquinone biosynthesis monooxygenase Coq7